MNVPATMFMEGNTFLVSSLSFAKKKTPPTGMNNIMTHFHLKCRLLVAATLVSRYEIHMYHVYHVYMYIFVYNVYIYIYVLYVRIVIHGPSVWNGSPNLRGLHATSRV